MTGSGGSSQGFILRVSELAGSGTAAHTALAILNYIMHGVGIFIAYMNRELKGEKRDNIASVEKDL